jgi:hypothetical protein
MAECRITFQPRHRAVPAPEGCGAIYTTHDTDHGVQRSKTHFAASPLDLTRKGVIFTAMGAPSKIPHNDYSEQWRRYKKFKKLRLFYLLGWIPVIAVYIMLIRIFGNFTLVFFAPYVLLGYAAAIGESICPPANYGLVYLHRGPLVGGLAVGIDVKLDNVKVAQLKVARFTRLVVAPGSHLLAAGSKTPFGELKQIAEAQRAKASFAISAGETAVFELKMIWTGMKKGTKLELVREADAAAASANLARVKMAASEQPAGWTQTPAPMQAPLDS